MIYQAEVVTQSGNLNIRTGPGTGYPIIGRLPKGEIVDVLEERGDWAHIIDGKEGWVSLGYLKREEPQPADPPEENEPNEDEPNETENETETKWLVVIPCESEEEARRYAGGIKTAVVFREDKPPDANKGE